MDPSQLQALRRARDMRLQARQQAKDSDQTSSELASLNPSSSRSRSGGRATTTSGSFVINKDAVSDGDQPYQSDDLSIQVSGTDGHTLFQAESAGIEEHAVNSSPSVRAVSRLVEGQRELVSAIQEKLSAALITPQRSPSHLSATRSGSSEETSPDDVSAPSLEDAHQAPRSGAVDSNAQLSPEVQSLQVQLDAANTVLQLSIQALAEERRQAAATFRQENPELRPPQFTRAKKSKGTVILHQEAPKATQHKFVRGTAALAPRSATLDKFFGQATLSERMALDEARFAAIQRQQPRGPSITETLMRIKPRKPTQPARLERKFSRRFDREERFAVATADNIGPESRSPDSVSGRRVNRDGYEENDFCVPDEFKDLVSESEESDADKSCSTLDSELEPSSDEEDFEPQARAAAIEAAFERFKSKAKSGPLLSYSCSQDKLQALRAEDVEIPAPTARTPMVELILNTWLRCDLAKVKIKHIDEFLRLLRLTPQEYALSVYYALAKRIRPISNSFYTLLFRCIAGYLPEHIPVFGRAHRDVWHKEEAKQPVAVVHAPHASPQMHAGMVERRKPSTRAPQLSDIHNIREATGNFYNAYKAYARDWKGWDHRKIFECLTPNQQAEFLSLSKLPEATVEAMELEEFMELWRDKLGIRSSAAVTKALQMVEFEGSLLAPSSWSLYHQRFSAVLLHAHTRHRPPGKMAAKTFMTNCGVPYLATDVLAFEPMSHTAARDLVLDRLDDGAFLQSSELQQAVAAAELTLKRKAEARLQAKTASNTSRSDNRVTFQEGHRHDGRRHAHEGRRHTDLDTFRRRDDRSGDTATPLQRAPEREHKVQALAPSATGALCTRCGRPGHTVNECVAKHDANRTLLPPVDDATYARRKAAALAVATKGLRKVNAVRDCAESVHSSDTSDIEAWAEADAQPSDEDTSSVCVLRPCCDETDDFCSDDCWGDVFFDCPERDDAIFFPCVGDFLEPVGCVCGTSEPAVDDVLAPSLLLCGDVESQPGPSRPTTSFKRTKPRHLELAAYLFIAATHTLPVVTPIPTATGFPDWAPPNLRPSVYWATANCSAVFPLQPVECVAQLGLRTAPLPSSIWLLTTLLITIIMSVMLPSWSSSTKSTPTMSLRFKLHLLALVIKPLCFMLRLKFLPRAFTRVLIKLLEMCGDVELNPGPTTLHGIPDLVNGNSDSNHDVSPSQHLPSRSRCLRFTVTGVSTWYAFHSQFTWRSVTYERQMRFLPATCFASTVTWLIQTLYFAIQTALELFQAQWLHVPAPSLLLCGDVESNPGPLSYLDMPALRSDSSTSDSDADATLPSRQSRPLHSMFSPVVLQPSPHVPPRSCFRPKAAQEISQKHRVIPSVSSTQRECSSSAPVRTPASPPSMPVETEHQPSLSAYDVERSFEDPESLRHIDAILGASSDTSDIEAQAQEALSAPRVCSLRAPADDTLLPPPTFIGFLTPSSPNLPPPESAAFVCAVDTMCQGQYSVISLDVATAAGLPLRSLTRTCRTADGSRVTCTQATDFTITIRVKTAWVSLPVTALVWKSAAEPLLLCNTLALQTGLIDLVAPNSIRVASLGTAAFSRDWKSQLEQEHVVALANYHADVMPEDVDDIIDLSAPLKAGDQDVSNLPADARYYAQLYPWMTKAIPRDAHPALEQCVYTVCEDKIPLYSWPQVNLKDMKEEKLPFAAVPRLHREFDKLIAAHYAEEVTSCPTAVAMRAQLVAKGKEDPRFCVNGSTQKNVLAVASFPMPHIRQIFAFVSSFPFRAKIDLKHGYHNFEIHPESRKWTTTIGAGRAIQWRKLVQGFAPSGAFFQHAMCKMLGPKIVWVIAAVYLDDIIIVGKTEAECRANVATVMAALAQYRFRTNFAKCVFTPATDIDFLGCSLRGALVHPGPKVPLMLAKILPPHVQRSTKAQRHHLHVFLGMCAFVLQHCPGLKTQLAPLYLSVASEPFEYGHTERTAFDGALGMLSQLQPYFLPSGDTDIEIVIMSDASGGEGTEADPGSWAAVLGQYRGSFNPDCISESFELLQTEGGVFNSRQCSWDILRKEAMALFQAFYRFKQFIWGRRIKVITDSKVLMYMFRSENVVIKRWHAYIQTFDYNMHHVSSEANALCDSLTRCLTVPPKPAPPTPRLLAAVRHTPTPSILLCGDVETQPGPAAIQHVPAPSILLCGDVESQPGPSSDDDAPIVAPTAPSPIIVSSGSSSNPSPATPPQRRHRRSAQQHAAPRDPPSRQAAVPPFDDAAADEEQFNAFPLADDAAAAEVHFESSSQSPARGQTVVLKVEQISRGPMSFCEAMSAAMQDLPDVDAHVQQLAIPFRPLDIRERTMWFLSEYGTTPMSLWHGLSFSQAFRQRPPTLSFSDRAETRVPDSFEEYRTLSALNETFPEPLFLGGAAVTYQCQLVIFMEDGSVLHVTPSHAFRRIFLFCSNDQLHYNWGAPLTSEHVGLDDVREWTFDAPPLRRFEQRSYKFRSFANTLDISAERLDKIHSAHCGYTGHPGVEATVKSLQAQGYKWQKMTAHVAQFIKRCPFCCSSRLRMPQVPTSASSLRLQARPLRRWHVDQTGNMGCCAFTGFMKLIVFVCETTQFCALYGSRHGTALETAIALIHLMGWTDLAESLHTDGGPEYDNYIWHQVQQITGLKHTLSVASAPSTNGIAERNVANAKRFVRSLTVDMGRHNAWGLLLPLAQKGLNDLRREDLQWLSPNEIVFGALHDHSSFVIPTFYSRALNESDLADANTYTISANFAHRAMWFQQMVVNSFHDLQARSFDAASRTNPSAFSDLVPGQGVLIDWPRDQPPHPTLPAKQGPYRVVDSRRNFVVLQHFSFPPPQDQSYIVHWSKHAHVYRYIDDEAPQRSASDPSASQAPSGPPSRNIDCVLSHQPKPNTASTGKRHVSNQQYKCRLYGTQLSARGHSELIRLFNYDEICHTFAFDSYVQAHRDLVGHTPVAHMPANWSPHAAQPTDRPSHPPLPPHEQLIRPDDAQAAAEAAQDDD